MSAYLALAENLPSSKAQRPGDIYRARNGKFIHVDNTDAEGRLVLADVLTYACEQGATHLVDAATLTGACMVALGEKVRSEGGCRATSDIDDDRLTSQPSSSVAYARVRLAV